MLKVALVTVVVLQWCFLFGSTPVTWAADTAPPPVPEATKPANGDADHPHVSKELQAELRKQCEADAKRLCHFVVPGGGRIFRCLEAHNSDLSDGCRKALSEVTPKP